MLETDLGLLRGVGDNSGRPLRMQVFERNNQQVVEGVLWPLEGDDWYPIIRGVPSFLIGPLQPELGQFRARHGLPPRTRAPERAGRYEQALTNTTFSDKWQRFTRYGIEPEHRDFLFGWYCLKLGLPDQAALRDFYRERDCVLEVGPGSGFNTRFIAENCRGRVFALDVSEAAVTTYENTRHLPNCTVVQADLMETPFPDDTFDLIIADGVLHHTPDTHEAVRALYRKLRPGGQFFFYVYRKMGPVRQFSDRHIRELFMKLSPEECYEACTPITELGRALSKLGATVTLDSPIPELGIPAGTHDVQRLIYYNFLKCFWNDSFDFETNNMVNFDWYHPHNAWQHTEDEVAEWLASLGAEFSFHNANPNGISVLVTRPNG